MARKKTNNFIEVFKIFFSSIKTYFMYLDQTSKALAFPIFGQFISVILIFTITYFVSENASQIMSMIPFLNSDAAFFTTFIIILLPFFIIFLKAFYDYIILFSSLNLVFYTNSNKKKIKNLDFESYNNSIQRRLFKYIILMIISVPLMIIAPFLVLIYQVFAMENDISPIGAIKRSIKMIKANFIPAVIMIVLCYIVTYGFLPALFMWVCQKISLYYFVLSCCERFLTLLPAESYTLQVDLGIINEYINEIISPLSIAGFLTKSTFASLIIGFTLPFRCCCFTELYRLFDAKNIKENSKMTDEIVKRATSKK